MYILEALQLYVAPSQLEAEALVERVSAHLQHSNGAVVLTAIRLLMKQFEVKLHQNVLLSFLTATKTHSLFPRDFKVL